MYNALILLYGKVPPFYINVCVCTCCVLSRSVVSNSLKPPWTVDPQAPLSVGILPARILEWVAMPFSRGSSQHRDRIQVSHRAGGFFTD